MLSRQLRIDAYGRRVRVTEICPGRVATEIFAHVHGDSSATYERFVKGFELPQPSDVADAIAFAIACADSGQCRFDRADADAPCTGRAFDGASGGGHSLSARCYPLARSEPRSGPCHTD